MANRLWYNKIKTDWMDALPLGNGRLAAMFFGLPGCERIEINEESLWSGMPLEENYISDANALSHLRELLFAEDYEEANKFADKNFLANPPRVRFYETFGDISINFGSADTAEEYCKFLDLYCAVAGADYKKDGKCFKTRSFISEDYDVFVYKAEADKRFDCTVSLCRGKDETVATDGTDKILMQGNVGFDSHEFYGDGDTGMGFAAQIRIKTDGEAVAENKAISITGATYIELFGAFETDYDANTFSYDNSRNIKSVAEEKCEAALQAGYDRLLCEHKKSHESIFGKVALDLFAEDMSHIPTDERLMRVQNGETDLGLVVLYYNFGRYLLIESSAKKQPCLQTCRENGWMVLLRHGAVITTQTSICR